MSKTIDINSSTFGERNRALEEALSGTVREGFEEFHRRAVFSKDRSSRLFAKRDPLAMTSTGFPGVDHILGGGVSEGMSIGVGGTYASGKSVFLLQMATNLAENGAAVMYVSPELTDEEVAARATARELDMMFSDGTEGRPPYLPGFGEIRRMRDRHGRPFDARMIEMIQRGHDRWLSKVGDRLVTLRYREGDTVENLEQAIVALRDEGHGGAQKILIVDPIQRLTPMRQEHMSPIQYESIMRSESERISLTCSQIKDIADRKSDSVTLMFGSDANADVSNPAESASAGFRGGAKVGNAATTLFFIDKPRVKEELPEFEARVLAQQNWLLDSSPIEGVASKEELSRRMETAAAFTTFKNREGMGGQIGLRLRGAWSRFVDMSTPVEVPVEPVKPPKVTEITTREPGDDSDEETSEEDIINFGSEDDAFEF